MDEEKVNSERWDSLEEYGGDGGNGGGVLQEEENRSKVRMKRIMAMVMDIVIVILGLFPCLLVWWALVSAKGNKLADHYEITCMEMEKE